MLNNQQNQIELKINRRVPHLLWVGLIVMALFSTSAHAAFSTVDCTDATHIATLEISQQTCEALEALWNSTDGPNWFRKNNWDTLSVARGWFGLTGGFSGIITRINLSFNGLNGTIPAELGNLIELEIISISDNQLIGSIPPEFETLTKLLLLEVQNNQLTDPIPAQIGSLASLQTMRMQDNLFTGEIPPQLGNLSELTSLILNNNQLTGQIPDTLQNLSKLTTLELSENAFSGQIPDLTNLPLVVFRIERNAFVFEDFETEFRLYTTQSQFSWSPQAVVDVIRSDSFIEGETLTITPQLPENPSGNDAYVWYHNGLFVAHGRIYTKTAALTDAGIYRYDVTNSVVTGLKLRSVENIASGTEGVTIDITQGPPPSDYSVGGTVSGLNGSLSLQNNGGDEMTVISDGSFIFGTLLADLSPYLVTISAQPNGQTCSVSNGSGTIAGANITNVAVTCIDDSVTTYTVGGTTSGLTGTGLQIQNNGSDTLSIAADGGFVFAIALTDLSAYTVSVSAQPTGQTCSVNNGSGSIAGADVTNVAVSCVDDVIPTYTVGGTTTGLTGSGLELQNNGSDTLTIAANSGFVFATALDDLSAYAVTVSAQPSGQTCSVSNGNGMIAAANVTDVAVDCIDDEVPPVIPDVPATPIPTLSEWALLMLFALLGLIVVTNKRRLF